MVGFAVVIDFVGVFAMAFLAAVAGRTHGEDERGQHEPDRDDDCDGEWLFGLGVLHGGS